MLIFIESIIIIAYMFDGLLGFLLMLLMTGWTLLVQKKNDFTTVFRLLIMSLPMSYIGVMGSSMHQIYSWYNIFLLFFLFRIIKYFNGKIILNRLLGIALISMFGLLLVNTFWVKDVLSNVIEIIQIFIMLLPISMIYSVKRRVPLSKKETEILIVTYTDVCVATAIGMLVQYILYYYANIQVGYMNIGGMGRVSCYCLFKGASILPIFMGIGLIVLFIHMLEKRMTLQQFIKCVVIAIAMVLNSSRTALFAVIIVLALICIRNIISKPNFKALFITGVGFAAATVGINYITSLRYGLTGFLDDNGRFGTFNNGIKVWLSSEKNILLGAGLTNDIFSEISKPHNFIIQTLAQCGLIFTVIIGIMVISYLVANWKNKYRYLLWFVFLTGMMVTDFYANAFTTVIFILVDIYGSKMDAQVN